MCKLFLSVCTILSVVLIKCVTVAQQNRVVNCPTNQQYYDCRPCQNNCQNRDVLISCTTQCSNPGCYCAPYYIANNSGRCIQSELCPGQCKSNEVYQECGTACPDTCANFNTTGRVCTKQCVPGCYCAGSRVRNQNGACVERTECPPVVETCGSNEEYYTCKPCTKTCDQIDEEISCTAICEPGCDCSEGTYRDTSSGQCVSAENCPNVSTQCDSNEVYNPCKYSCPPDTCEIIYTLYRCQENQTCSPGCTCKDGYLRNSMTQLCVPSEECPGPTPVEEICGSNEEYYTCKPCTKTCDQIDEEISCIAVCEPGCDCSEGTYRDTSSGQCVSAENCPNVSTQCDSNEVYNPCKYSCPPDTCEIIYTLYRCQENQTCSPGCTCKDGYLRNSMTQLCVPSEECPGPTPVEETCGSNEEYFTCKPCTKTCDQIDEEISCIAVCEPGCDCSEGTYRDTSSGQCVSAENCPNVSTQCDSNEVYNPCKYSCPPDSCESMYALYKCRGNQTCSPGCTCKDGYLRNSTSQLCVPSAECPRPTPVEETCGSNEEYYTCKPCTKSCDQIDEDISCIAVCQPGCDCSEGTYRDTSSGQCVSAENCAAKCPCNEVYVQNPSICNMDSCLTLGDDFKCPRKPQKSVQLNPRCECKETYLRNEDGLCIPFERCPECPRCGPNEIYKDCRNVCPGQSCKTLYIQVNCLHDIPCEPGCDCLDGYRRDEDGYCIPVEACPSLSPTCPDNEYWNDTGTACPPTCTNRNPNCTESGFGCYCKEGYLRDKTNKCVPQENCGCNGDSNAVLGCGFHCNNTCASLINPQRFCPRIQCTGQGCDCKEGYVFDPNLDICLLPEQCTQTCNSDEVYVPCLIGDCSPKTCTQYLGLESVQCPRIASPELCKGGCKCAEGTVKNASGDCVAYEQCAGECPADEKYIPCRLGYCGPETCREFLGIDPVTCADLLPNATCDGGCICEDGYKRNDSGICVPESQCANISQQCNGDEYAEPGCGTNCGRKCTDIGRSEPQVCTLSCQLNGCDCKAGYLYDEPLQKCVSKFYCSNTCDGDPNAVRGGCGQNCNKLCSDVGRTVPRNCPVINCFRAGCECKSDHYFDQTILGCVLPENCTPGQPPPEDN